MLSSRNSEQCQKYRKGGFRTTIQLSGHENRVPASQIQADSQERNPEIEEKIKKAIRVILETEVVYQGQLCLELRKDDAWYRAGISILPPSHAAKIPSINYHRSCILKIGLQLRNAWEMSQAAKSIFRISLSDPKSANIRQSILRTYGSVKWGLREPRDTTQHDV